MGCEGQDSFLTATHTKGGNRAGTEHTLSLVTSEAEEGGGKAVKSLEIKPPGEFREVGKKGP